MRGAARSINRVTSARMVVSSYTGSLWSASVVSSASVVVSIVPGSFFLTP